MIDVTSGDGVAVVTIRRPPHNFFDADLVRDLVRVAGELAAGGDVRAVVLASEGRNFCAGADLTRGSAAVFSDDGTHIYDHALALFRQPLPIVAAVHGKAVGGGLGLALAADLRVGNTNTAFVANFASIGLHQGFGISVTLPAAVGPSRAADMLYTSRPVRGEEALRIGLLDRLADGDPVVEARALAAEIAAASGAAVASIRATLRRQLVASLADAMAHERAEQERLMAALRQETAEGE